MKRDNQHFVLKGPSRFLQVFPHHMHDCTLLYHILFLQLHHAVRMQHDYFETESRSVIMKCGDMSVKIMIGIMMMQVWCVGS